LRRIQAIGWGQFEVRTTDQGISDHLRAFAAGYVEGHLTAHRIRQQIANYRHGNEFLLVKLFSWTASALLT
jgi:hypothetical protein